MAKFVPGLQLCGLFYEEAVGPVIEAEFPGLSHSAARIGSGSEILGYDTPRSTDHEWGPRLQLFLSAEDHERLAARLTEVLSEQLPHAFRGYPVHFGEPDEEGVQIAERKTSGPVNHKVEVHTVRSFFESSLGPNPYAMTPTDWLLVPQQRLLEVTAGRVYHDGLGELEAVRARLAYYPRDVWLLLLAAQWRRISQQEAFVGRTGEAGDDLGSRLVAADLVRDLMRLCFLMEQKYAPYSKWFGTAFSRLGRAASLSPVFEQVLAADLWQEREKHLVRAYKILAGMHNELGLTAPLETQASRFHDRPFLVIHGDRFAAALEDAIDAPEVKALDADSGSVDQFVSSTDVLARPEAYERLRALFEP